MIDDCSTADESFVELQASGHQCSNPDTTFNLPTCLFFKRDGAFAVKRSRSQRLSRAIHFEVWNGGPSPRPLRQAILAGLPMHANTAWGPQYHAQGAEIWTHTFNPGSAYKVVVQKYSCRCFFANRGAVYGGVSFVQERQALPQLVWSVSPSPHWHQRHGHQMFETA